MHRLSRFTQNLRGTRTMNTQRIANLLSIPRERSSDSQPGPASSHGLLEVNVIFTNPRATAAALKCAESLAQGLQATIRLRAAIVVPWQLPLDEPHVSVAFTERLLSGLISRLDGDSAEGAVDLYVCRDWRETLLQVLHPDSPVVIGRGSRWWPGPENRLAKALRSKGYRVIFADSRGRAGAQPSVTRDTEPHPASTTVALIKRPAMKLRDRTTNEVLTRVDEFQVTDRG
jgi:hypothetical protein